MLEINEDTTYGNLYRARVVFKTSGSNYKGIFLNIYELHEALKKNLTCYQHFWGAKNKYLQPGHCAIIIKKFLICMALIAHYPNSIELKVTLIQRNNLNLIVCQKLNYDHDDLSYVVAPELVHVVLQYIEFLSELSLHVL